MLQALKKYQKYNKFFYGINRGTFGFLMNKYKTKNVIRSISKAKQVNISPLKIRVLTKDNKYFSAIAINEMSLFRQSKQQLRYKFLQGKKF